jgi:tetratricopeptide (TPR) repeat protein
VDKAIALGTKKTIKAYQIRSNIHTERGDFDKAVADANKAIELGPKDALGYLLRANAHARKNVHVGIKRDIDKALDLDSELAFGYMLRGQWYLLKHRMKANPEMLDKAITDLETAVKLDPTEWQGRMWRGVAYGEKEDAKKAFADFDAAIRHRPNQPRIYENRADLHRRLGNDKAADDDEEKAREIRRKAI